MDKNSDVRTRLNDLLRIKRISKQEMADKTGIQISAICNYTNGYRIPRQDKISMICDAFEIDPAWLMGYDVPMQKKNYPTAFQVGKDAFSLIIECENLQEIDKNRVSRLLSYVARLNANDLKKLERNIENFADITETTNLLDKE